MRRVVGSCIGVMAVVMAVVMAAVTVGVTVGVTTVAALGTAGVSEAGTGGARVVRVVTLGDSYSAGTGIHRDASDYDDQGPPAHSFDAATRLGSSMCLRELDTTPGARLAAELGATSSVAACAGAEIADVVHQVDAAAIDADGTGTVVTITVGGNDVRTRGGGDWTDVLLDCVISPGCHRDDDNELANLDAVGEQLTQLYTTLGDEYPGLAVRVLGYPRLMQPDRWGCVGVTGVGRKEARWIDEQVDRLNEVIDLAARRAHAWTGADVRYVPVEDAFDNHGACRVWQRDRYVNDAIWGEQLSRVLDDGGRVVERRTDGPFTLSAASFHPSQRGYDAFLTALRASTAPVP